MLNAPIMYLFLRPIRIPIAHGIMIKKKLAFEDFLFPGSLGKSGIEI
jgi:hypothetical protein